MELKLKIVTSIIHWLFLYSNFPPFPLPHFEGYAVLFYLASYFQWSCLKADLLLKMKKSLAETSFETFHPCCEKMQLGSQDKTISSNRHLAEFFASDCFDFL